VRRSSFKTNKNEADLKFRFKIFTNRGMKFLRNFCKISARASRIPKHEQNLKQGAVKFQNNLNLDEI